MSSSHAETPTHAVEQAAETESAVETFAHGIGNIIDSVRIAFKKVYGGVKGLLKNIWGELFTAADHGHASEHGQSADTHGDAHAAPAPAHH